MKKLLWAMTLGTCLIFQTQCSKKSEDACGFVQNSEGQRVSWKNQTPIRLYFDTSVPQEFYAPIKQAIDTWHQGINRVVFVVQGQLPTSQPAQDGISVIYWVHNWPQDEVSRAQQANTTIYWANNQLTEADIRVNRQNFSFISNVQPGSPEVDIQSLFLHELGHVLGLKHVDSEPSVMAKALPAGTTRQSLYPIDISDARCEY